MASGDELLNQLINGADPYRPATNLLSQWRYDPVKAGDSNIGKAAAVGLGQVLLTQMLNNESRDYRADQRRALSTVMPTLRNNPLGATKPDGLNSDVFEAARAINLENFLDTAQKIALDNYQYSRDLGKQSQGNREQMIANAINQNPRAKYDPDWAMAQFEKMLGGGELKSEPAAKPVDEVTKREQFQLSDPDTALYKEANKERGVLAKKEQTLKYIDQKFDEAKELTGSDALLNSLSFGMVPTEKGQLLSGLGDSVVVQIDTTLGREINSDVRERLLGMAPKPYDSADTIEKKKIAMKELVSSLYDPTPILSKHELVSATPAPTPTATAKQGSARENSDLSIQERYKQLRNTGVSKEEAARILGIE